MAGLHNGSPPFWSVFSFMPAHVGVCHEVDAASSRAPGVRVCQIITLPAPTFFEAMILQSQALILVDRDVFGYVLASL